MPIPMLGALALLLGCSASQVSQSAAPLPGSDERSFFEEVDLFHAGDLGVHTYRIPALAVTTAGTLLAVCDARQDDSSDLPGNIDLVLRRSLDLGRSWSPVAVIRDEPEGFGAGDPSLLVDRDTGRVYCFFAYAAPGIGFFTSQGGSNDADDPNTLHARYITSDDDGLTWSEAVDLNPQIKRRPWLGLFASSGHGLQLRGGRLIQPYTVRNASAVTSSRNAISDDHGATWRMGAAAGTDVNESKLFERVDGTVVQNMRHNSVKSRFLASSTDGGESFGAPSADPVLIDPNVNASVERWFARLDGDPHDVLAFSNPANAGARENMTVRVSFDEGASWPLARRVHGGPAAYSSLCALPDGSMGLLYERGDTSSVEKISFARFNLAWLSGGDRQRPPVLNAVGVPRANHPDLWAWYDAARRRSANGPGPDENGDALLRWDDLSAHGRHHLVRVSDRPGVFRSKALEGVPAAVFRGDRDLWGAASSSAEFGTPSNPYTVFLLARLDAARNVHYLFDRTTGRGGVGLRAIGGGGRPCWEVHVARSFSGPAVELVLPSADVPLGIWQVHTVELDGIEVRHHVDGHLVAQASFDDGGFPLHQGGLILSADVGTENDANCAVAQVLAYDAILAPKERAAVEDYLLARIPE